MRTSPLLHVAVEPPPIEIALRIGVLWQVGVFLLEEALDYLDALLGRRGVVLLVPKMVQITTVCVLVVLISSTVYELLLVRDAFELVNAELANLLVRVSAVACARWNAAADACAARLARDAALVFVFEPHGGTRSGQAVPRGILVLYFAIPLPMREVVACAPVPSLATHCVAIVLEVEAAVRPCAFARVEGIDHREVHTRVVQRLRRPNLDLELLQPGLRRGEIRATPF
mmetsp:Transcript_66327/g.202996  ORF Transcript_66327/g.202996 Transcript_66327/m.202996 type:complete len:229 (+) Transcript_66327:41-727(+)